MRFNSKNSRVGHTKKKKKKKSRLVRRLSDKKKLTKKKKKDVEEDGVSPSVATTTRVGRSVLYRPLFVVYQAAHVFVVYQRLIHVFQDSILKNLKGPWFIVHTASPYPGMLRVLHPPSLYRCRCYAITSIFF